TITTLNLYANNIGAEGASYLASASSYNTTLTILDLNDNNIGDKGTRYLTNALKHNQ
ncbi:unnamed protein product, partial [Rotaria magnacalcarata]